MSDEVKTPVPPASSPHRSAHSLALCSRVLGMLIEKSKACDRDALAYSPADNGIGGSWVGGADDTSPGRAEIQDAKDVIDQVRKEIGL